MPAPSWYHPIDTTDIQALRTVPARARWTFLELFGGDLGTKQGIVDVRPSAIAAELGESRVAIESDIAALAAARLIVYSPVERMAYHLGHLLRHGATNDKHRAGWANVIAALAPCCARDAALSELSGIPYRYPIDTLPKGYPARSQQEQEQEQEQEQNVAKATYAERDQGSNEDEAQKPIAASHKPFVPPHPDWIPDEERADYVAPKRTPLAAAVAPVPKPEPEQIPLVLAPKPVKDRTLTPAQEAAILTRQIAQQVVRGWNQHMGQGNVQAIPDTAWMTKFGRLCATSAAAFDGASNLLRLFSWAKLHSHYHGGGTRAWSLPEWLAKEHLAKVYADADRWSREQQGRPPQFGYTPGVAPCAGHLEVTDEAA